MSPSLLGICSALASLVALSQAAYVIHDDYTPSTFFDKFEFFTEPDPTHGFVDYVNQTRAKELGLARLTNGSKVYMGVDHKTQSPEDGRASVRISSNKTYTHGLFIADISHMPGGICGTWPAFWMFGANWPNQGEIGILEGVHTSDYNAITLHSGAGCVMLPGGAAAPAAPAANRTLGRLGNAADVLQTGNQTTTNCQAMINDNVGCSVKDLRPTSYGAGFNANGGGVYAMEWTSKRIAVWFFPRGDIPANVVSAAPDPATWGTPAANFAGPCDIDSHFKENRIIFDTTFCGDWAGNTWAQSTCAPKAKTCNAFVAKNPTAFKDAYWEIGALRVFKDGGAGAEKKGGAEKEPVAEKKAGAEKEPVAEKEPIAEKEAGAEKKAGAEKEFVAEKEAGAEKKAGAQATGVKRSPAGKNGVY
ncbi:MAG: hypothetical protein M1832_006229 [Thelocarpon impressellum]|nr:MAG: hypothetical protein M1832_006229 [Thelocarpon impressellum]